MTKRVDIVAYARSQLGVRWQHQACLPGVALDCLGLIASIPLALGMEGAEKWRADPRMKNYSQPPNSRVIVAACSEYLDEIRKEQAGLGDILIMDFANAPQHFAIVSCLRPMKIIHAYTSVGRVVETMLGGGWDERVVRAYRYRGVEPDLPMVMETTHYSADFETLPGGKRITGKIVLHS